MLTLVLFNTFNAMAFGAALGNLGVNIFQPLSFWKLAVVVTPVGLIVGLWLQTYIIWRTDAPRP
jgi:hypothetical protein